ncbi:DNA excision repair protein ERCC-5 [Pristis pectinata]|uniref:DNA excision repair protein ERCC-5 n=1 Tax=Pristis pectinata TaxID=685728 RepID=UPI00223D468F|nr:DNA excision repair protein ERCC-5 [Pristis pectinata]
MKCMNYRNIHLVDYYSLRKATSVYQRPNSYWLHSMPNSSEYQPPKPTGNVKSINVLDELAAGDPPGASNSNLFSCYGAPSFSLSSSVKEHGPWMFPVVRAQEVFYNVCSDYGLLNKASIIASTPCTSSEPTAVQDGTTSVDAPGHNSSYVQLQVDPPDVTHRGNAEKVAMPVSHGKQLLAWEIDTSDFNVVTSKLKSRTGSLKKQSTKKIKPLEKHNKKNDSSPYTVLEEMKQRKVLDLRRWYCISRPQYKTSCGISSLVSCWNYLFSTCGTGSLPPITQEEALHILGFHQPFEDIRFGPFTGNATLMRWFRQLNEHFHMRGCSYVLYKPHGKNRTAGETAEGALLKLTQGLKDESMAFIYHCQNHYFCPIGFEATPLKASKAFRGKLPLEEMEFWILIGEPSKKHPAIHCKKWTDIVTDLNTQNPEYLDIRNPEKGIQYRKTKKVGGNLHCIIAFQKLNWQKLSTWMMNIGNFRCEPRSKVLECKASSSTTGLDRVLNDHQDPSMNDKSNSEGFQQASEWNHISSPYEYRDCGSPESETDEETVATMEQKNKAIVSSVRLARKNKMKAYSAPHQLSAMATMVIPQESNMVKRNYCYSTSLGILLREAASPSLKSQRWLVAISSKQSIMGVQGLWKLLECTGQPTSPETLEGKILAVDISIWLNQAVKGARDRHGNSIPNAHLLILLHRLCKLLFYRIRPLVVFDGKMPLLKKQTLENRWKRKDLAVKDTKKTTDKLMKTFLKRLALKTAFGGKSDEIIPSLSRVRREETDDIFILPSLAQKEENSSDEEAEKEWEERIKNERSLQNEFLENPNSVNIDSEDFASLPPEIRHEILTDLKEFTKRRRSLMEPMPQESADFSQYQLSGLLKRNRLNQHIEGVQKEMNKQYCGEVQMDCNNEGGFFKDMETRRLVSEDASHYILIKGIQSNNTEDTESNKQNTPEKIINSAGAEAPSNADWEPFKDSSSSSPPTASTTKAENDGGSASDCPSPRTMIAIEAAMLESGSDDEMASGEDKLFPFDCSSTLYSTGTASKNLNMSPRAHQAIQQALEEIEVINVAKEDNGNEYSFTGNQVARSCSSNDEREDQETFGSDCEVHEIPLSLKTTQRKPILPGNDQNCNMQAKLPAAEESSPVSATEQNNNVTTGDISEVINNKQKSEQINFQTSENVQEHRSNAEMHLDSNSKKCIHPLGTVKFLENNNTNSGAIPSIQQPSLTSALDTQPVDDVKKLLIKGELDLRNFCSEKEKQDFVEESFEDQKKSAKDEDQSDSEGSFIEVIDTNKTPLQDELFPPDIFVPLIPANESTPKLGDDAEGSLETAQIVNEEQSAVIGDHVEEVEKIVQQNTKEEPDQPKWTNVEEAITDEWSELNLGEVEELENSLFLKQSGLQSQKQQQERVAATITGQMYLDIQELLRLFGIPYIIAPMEAEAQCAYLDMTDQTSGTITDDSDIWLFGARHVYKNFFNQDKYVEYYQYIHIHNQLGLDRRKLINLAYFLGSDYTEGIPGVGYVTAMELLNEFLGPGLEPLFRIRDWWTEAQKSKKLRDNPNDTKVKKKLRHLDIYPGFPNPAVAEAYLKPVIDESEESFSWGRPDLEEIREYPFFCQNRFGWTRKKTDEVLLPVMKQLNAQQSQPRIDTFFRVEQYEKQAIKSQRLRRAVTCMLRKGEETSTEAQEPVDVLKGTTNSAEKAQEVASGTKNISSNSQLKCRKRKQPWKSPDQQPGGGFIGAIHLSEMSSDSAEDDFEFESKKYSKTMGFVRNTPEKMMKDGEDKTVHKSSSSSEENEDDSMVTAKPVFVNKRRMKGLKIKQRMKLKK